MNKFGMTRRTMLRGLLMGSAVTVGLPWLEWFGSSAMANPSGIPPRFVLFFWGNGVHPDRWVPNGEGTDWTLSEQLSPLAAVKDEITVISGMEVKVPNQIPHSSGAAGILTGLPLLIEGESETFGGPSIDQVIAREIGSATRFKSLELGASEGASRSSNGQHSINPSEASPYKLYERLFGAGFRMPGEETTLDPTLALRRSVLDGVLEDGRALKKRVSGADRQRLDQHFTAVRELELRLAKLEDEPPMRLACAVPTTPNRTYDDVEGRPQISAKNRVMCDLVAMALACDQTRVVSNFITSPVNNILFPGATAGHHQLTHDEPGDQPQVHSIVLQLVAEFGYLVETLRTVPEGDCTLLDNCVVLGTTDVSYGRTHSLDEFPILLAGTAGGRLKKGLHYRSTSRENASKVHLTCMRALGINAESFGGEQGEAQDSISALEA